MSTATKAEQSAEQIQNILEAYHLANSQNVRLRAEVETLRSKVRSFESSLEEKERHGLPQPQPTESEEAKC